MIKSALEKNIKKRGFPFFNEKDRGFQEKLVGGVAKSGSHSFCHQAFFVLFFVGDMLVMYKISGVYVLGKKHIKHDVLNDKSVFLGKTIFSYGCFIKEFGCFK